MRTRFAKVGWRSLLSTGASLATLLLAAGARWKPLDRGPMTTRKGEGMRLRKIAYALASLAALAMAVGAGWRPF